VEREKWSANGVVIQDPSLGVEFCNNVVEVGASLASTDFTSIWVNDPVSDQFAGLEKHLPFTMSECLHPDQRPSLLASSTSLAGFVEQKFIPEYVARKRLAGRSHFQAILKHILTPRLADRAFGLQTDQANVRLKETPGWPYLDSLRLDEVTPERIQHLVSAAMRRGYSTQMATHIRNVLCAIFWHAIKSGVFNGTNPAVDVALPAMSRKKAHTLSLSQLKQVMHWMRYPEREIALLMMLTDMSVAEICGLRWKYLNLSADRHLADGHRIPPRTIAVWNQSYRGEFGPVMEKRKRFIPIPDLLSSTLLELKARGKFTSTDDFVLASRTGTPISPDNLTARRLKSIGKRLDMPWLSWNVFHRTQAALKRSAGRQWIKELESILPRNTGPKRSE